MGGLLDLREGAGKWLELYLVLQRNRCKDDAIQSRPDRSMLMNKVLVYWSATVRTIATKETVVA